MTDEISKCPCTDCICLPMCRYKGFNELVDDCKIVLGFLYHHSVRTDGNRHRNFSKSIVEIEKQLKPNRWYINVNLNGFANIRKV